MAVTAKNARFLRELALIEKARKSPEPKKVLPPRERIRIKLRCRLCGRPRAVYRKFGICRICFRMMAWKGLLPGVKKSSW
jgi:small subunit ribosomal protein S14